jgi:hypothetical protein
VWICRTRVESALDFLAPQLSLDLFFDGFAPATHLHRKQPSSAFFLRCHGATTVFLLIEHMSTRAANGMNYQSRFT